LIFVEKSEGAKKIAGFLGSPVIGRANRNFETYFINGRYIKNSIISKAAEDAYKTYLMQHKYPFFVLHITLEPDCMDVNVHPSKMEVRFHDAKEISDFVYQAIYEALSGKEMLKKVVFEDEKESPEKTPEKEIVPEPFEVQARKSMLLKEEPVYSKESSFEPIAKKETPKWSVNELLGGTENKDIHSNIIKKESHILVEKPVQMNFFDEKIITREFRDEYRILGQVFDTYWILAFRDKMLIIDQHAAHEKVKYERLCKQIREKQVVSQQMNPPLILTLSGKEELVLKEYQTSITALHFDAEELGCVACRQLLDMLDGREVEDKIELGYQVVLRESTKVI